jgi:hypothetical protein
MRCAALVALLVVAPACGDDLRDTTITFELDGSAGWPERRAFELHPGGLAEAGLQMRAGDSVDVEFTSAGGEVAWDIHIHDGDEIRTELEGHDGAGSFTFVAPSSGVYWSLWLDDGPGTLELDVSFEGQGSTVFRGWL